MNEKTIDQIEEVLICEISDEAVEAAGRAEIAGVWTFVCTGAYLASRANTTLKWYQREMPLRIPLGWRRLVPLAY